MTHREPPEFDAEELDSMEVPTFLPPDPHDQTNLILWSALPDSQKNWIIRQWTTKAWPSLVQFCNVHNLNYRSVYDAFARRDLPTAPAVRDKLAVVAQKETLNELLDNSQDFARVGSLVCHRLGERLTQYDGHSVKDLLALAHNVSALADNFAETAKKISEIAAVDATAQGSATKSQLPEAFRARLQRALRSIAEQEIREKEAAAV